MAFMKDNEHIIFMEMCTKYEYPEERLPAEDIRKLVDAGVETCMSFGTFWGWMEPSKGVYDWSYYDNRIGLLTRLGMKVILHAQSSFPLWVPEDWRLKAQNGNTERVISVWNDEAWEYTKDFYRQVRDRYNSNNVLVTSSWQADGETLFPITFCVFDDQAKQKYLEFYGHEPTGKNPETQEFLLNGMKKVFCDLQGIMKENKFNEIWTCMHPATSWNLPSTQNAISEILAMFHDYYPDITINHLYCTWTQWRHMFPTFNEWGKKYGNVYGGAEYETGIIANTQLAKENGVKGLLYGPCHPFTGHSRVTQEMLDKARESLALWG